MASRAGRYCLLDFGQVPWCLSIWTCGIGLHPLYQAYFQSDGWYSFKEQFMWMPPHALWAVQHAGHVSEVDAKLSQWVKPHLLPHLLRQHNCILTEAEEHIHRLHVVFDQFREYNLKLKPSKCSLFKEEINYLAHQVSKEGVQPSDSNLKVITECALLRIYMEVQAFLSLVDHYWWFLNGYACIAQLWNEHLTGEGASRKSEWLLLLEDSLKAFNTLKQACMSTLVLTFSDHTKEFLLETDASREGLVVVLSKRQADGWYHLVTYGSRALTDHERNYHSTKLEFLVLQWAVTEHFKEYLPYQHFLVRTDNNPLTYILTTPNLDATGHWWVGALVRFNFQLEYEKGWDNTVADILSQITNHLNPEAMRSVLNGVTLGAAHRAVVEGDCGME